MNQRVIGFTRRQRISIGTEVFPNQVFQITEKGMAELKQFNGLVCDLTPNYVAQTFRGGPTAPLRQVKLLQPLLRELA